MIIAHVIECAGFSQPLCPCALTAIQAISRENKGIKIIFARCMKFDLTHIPLRFDSLYFCSKMKIAAAAGKNPLLTGPAASHYTGEEE